MSEVAMIGIDLAKRVFQLHGACAKGTVVFRKKLTRIRLLAFMSQQSAASLRWRRVRLRIAGAENL